jgi:NTP pyrophosphatase (non-canonical NTP hydrolase)
MKGSLTLDEYQVLASRTANGIDNETDRRFNALLGLFGETGELAENAFRGPIVVGSFMKEYFEFVDIVVDFGRECERIKHELFHKHPEGHIIKEPELTRENRREELGDILWYLTWLCSEFGFSLEEVAQANIAKLRERYPEGFSVERSINRKDGSE